MSWKIAVDSCSAQAWDDLVRSRGCVYQGWEFAATLEEGLRQRIVRLAAVDTDGTVGAALAIAVLKSPLFGRFGVSLPVSDHSGVVYREEAALRVVMEELPGFLAREGLDWIELRHFADPAPPVDLLAREHKITLELALPPDAEVLWTGLKAKVRNLVRKGEKAGLVYHQGGAERLEVFHRVYAHNLRDLGTPCYPKSFFAALLRRFEGVCRIHLATLGEGGPVAAVGLTLRDGARQQIPFAASRVEYRRHSPNMFLYWRMLADAIENGCDVFDFGRSTRDSGTHRFKKQWGAVERPLRWFHQLAPGAEMPELRVDSPKYRLAVSAWKRLPVGVATALSARIVRHLP